ncbi:hypothetical protein NQ318_010710 [Aromia moschata]|uniref:HTH CENPB-type domain-containing protein n=1 Tax=Aromia moschata TaxID=1265417 RepID=A0AAV8XNZ1_9CUCU|nr:hypothetical protein NQ318_010710 [Aromia moschata]
MLPGAKERVMQRKEPAKRLTLEQKLELINHAKNGVINVELCKMYNICKSSVTEILGKKEIYLSEFERRRKLSGRINTKKCTGIYDTPFEKKRTLGEPVSAVLLRKFAKNMYTNFYEETDFKASDGWLRGFKDRHGIRTLNTKGEKLSVDTEEAQAILQMPKQGMDEPKSFYILVYRAWSDVSAETLRNAWGKLIDRDMSRENSCQDSTLEACNLLNKLPKSKEITLEDTSEWLQADSTEDTWRRLTDEEIIAAAQGYPIQYDSDTELHENENDGATTMMS